MKPLVELYNRILEDSEIFDGISPTLDDDDGEEPYHIAIKDIRTILWNFSDTSKDFGMSIAQDTDFFQSIVKDLQITFKEGLDLLVRIKLCICFFFLHNHHYNSCFDSFFCKCINTVIKY